MSSAFAASRSFVVARRNASSDFIVDTEIA